jgi:transglutaminase-like putative cysteine protease
MEQLERYLKPTSTIDCDNASVKGKAWELTKGQEDPADKARSLFYFVRDQIKYNMYVPFHLIEHYKASTILQKGEGYCVQKAVLMTALARAIDMPARLGFADIMNHLLPEKFLEIHGTNLLVYHGFTELYLNDTWIRVTPIFDLEMCRKHRIIPVDFDGKNDARFHPVNQDGKPHIEYVRYHGSFEDLPLHQMLNARQEAMGEYYQSWTEEVVCGKRGESQAAGN